MNAVGSGVGVEPSGVDSSGGDAEFGFEVGEVVVGDAEFGKGML